jgi:hypothetical protein
MEALGAIQRLRIEVHGDHTGDGRQLRFVHGVLLRDLAP